MRSWKNSDMEDFSKIRDGFLDGLGWAIAAAFFVFAIHIYKRYL